MEKLVHSDDPVVQTLATRLQESGIFMQHVPHAELPSAIARAMNEHILQLTEEGLSPGALAGIAEVIDCNEEQTSVHELPGDPD